MEYFGTYFGSKKKPPGDPFPGGYLGAAGTPFFGSYFGGTSDTLQPANSNGFATYAGFRTRVLSYIDTDGADLDTDLVDDIVLLGEKKIAREIRCREVEAPLSVAVVRGTAPIPPDYLDLKNARTYVGGRAFVIERVDVSQIGRRHLINGGQRTGATASSYGGPLTMARDGDHFVFGPSVAESAVIEGTYYRAFVPLIDREESLIDPTSSSFQPLYAANPALYLYAALSEAEMLISRMPRAQLYAQKYAQLAAALQTQSEHEQYSGGPMRMRAR